MTPRVLAFAVVMLLAAPASADPTIIAPEYPPFAMLRDGQPAGPLIDLVRDLARRVGLPDRVSILPALRWRFELLHGDHIAPFFTRTPEREKDYVWIAPIYRDCARFVTVGDHPPVVSLDDARRLGRIANVSAGSSHDFLVAHGLTNLVAADSERQAAQTLTHGRADAWFGLCSNQAIALARQPGIDPHFGPPLIDFDLWIVGSKTIPDSLATRLRDAFAAMKANGDVARHLAHLPKPALPPADPRPAEAPPR
jgi:ABC-type amino acid transport substrate-binding protein